MAQYAMRANVKRRTKTKCERRVFNHNENTGKQIEKFVLVDNGLALQPELSRVVTALAYRIGEG